MNTYPNPTVLQYDPVPSEDDTQLLVEPPEDLSEVLKDKLGYLFLKLESWFNVPNKCIDEIVDELQFISCSASGLVLRDVVESTFKSHN